MNYAAFITIPDSHPHEEVLKLATALNKQECFFKLKKGIRLFFKDAKTGLNGEDFRNAQYTLRLRFIGYRIPRFLKTYLLSKQ